jgi:pimeloyl-ACP methyl ester carboxylesterase
VQIIFVHGAFVADGAWWWEPAAALLRGRGIDSTALALPSCGETGIAPSGAGPDLHADAAALRAMLDLAGGPVMVVAHSYGGMVATQGAAGHPALRHLVYISSFVPAVGESALGAAQAGPPVDGPDPLRIARRPDGALEIADPDLDARVLHDVTDPDVIAAAHGRLVPQSAAVFGQPVTAAAWTGTPSTYLVCADDRNTAPLLQRTQAARASRTIELDSGHHPFLSHPAEVADIVATAAAAR